MVTAAILGNLLSGEGKTILMSKKKKTKKKRNRPRKGVMPLALKAYWAKKRAQKQNSRRRKKKNTRRRPRKTANRRRPNRKRPLKQAKAILLNELRKAGYAIAPKPNRRRRRKANRRKKQNPPRSIRIPGTVTTKQRKAIGRFLARATGRRIVYKKAGRR